ncbi:22865_t:CDS:2 [Gigaspora margarita]|uniref:22865_t:CDS:1 n=1 Tax=Gigaspora margarita TaxID=4874 RepID=A0ABM8VWR4_GIGMA|nr:22865_t:CDS:2 [Gigaspora margarita]
MINFYDVKILKEEKLPGGSRPETHPLWKLYICQRGKPSCFILADTYYQSYKPELIENLLIGRVVNLTPDNRKCSVILDAYNRAKVVGANVEAYLAGLGTSELKTLHISRGAIHDFLASYEVTKDNILTHILVNFILHQGINQEIKGQGLIFECSKKEWQQVPNFIKTRTSPKFIDSSNCPFCNKLTAHTGHKQFIKKKGPNYYKRVVIPHEYDKATDTYTKFNHECKLECSNSEMSDEDKQQYEKDINSRNAEKKMYALKYQKLKTKMQGSSKSSKSMKNSVSQKQETTQKPFLTGGTIAIIVVIVLLVAAIIGYMWQKLREEALKQ